MTTSRKKLIFVLAMHRSGSSAITKALNVLGVALGDSLLPGIEGNNLKGFFEDKDFVQLNADMLSAINQDWHHVTGIDNNQFEFLYQSGFVSRAAELLRQKTQDFRVFGIKDPRASKLLPLWQKALSLCDFDVHYLLAVRNPISVSESLHQRNGFVAGKSYLLWLQHVLNALTITTASSRAIIDYDNFLDDPEHSLDHCASKFGLTVNKRQLEIYRNEFLDQSLRHARFTIADFQYQPMCPPLVRNIYTALHDWSLGECKHDNNEIKKLIALWNKQAKLFKPLLPLVDTLSERNDEYYQAAAKCGQLASTQQETIFRLEAQHRDRELLLQSRIEDLELKIKEISEAASEQDNEYRNFSQNQGAREHALYDQLLRTNDELHFVERELTTRLIDNTGKSTSLQNGILKSVDAIQENFSSLTKVIQDATREFSEKLDSKFSLLQDNLEKIISPLDKNEKL